MYNANRRLEPSTTPPERQYQPTPGMLTLTGSRLFARVAPRTYLPRASLAAALPAPTKATRHSSVVTRELRTGSQDKFADADDRRRELSSLSGWSEVSAPFEAM